MGSEAATPLVTVSGYPTLEPSTANCTVPVGVPPPSEATVAVKVTGWPTRDGLTDDRIEVVVGYPCTTWSIEDDVDWLNAASPEYVAVTVWVPGMSEVTPERVATPSDTGAEPRTSLPSATNWTVPVGVPAPGEVTVTVAVKATGVPTSAGLVADPSDVVVSAPPTVWPPARVPVLPPQVPSPL